MEKEADREMWRIASRDQWSALHFNKITRIVSKEQTRLTLAFDLVQMLLYGEIEKSGITYISVGHRSTLRQFHSNILKISKVNEGGCSWTFGPIDRQPDLEVIGSSL